MAQSADFKFFSFVSLIINGTYKNFNFLLKKKKKKVQAEIKEITYELLTLIL
jgi:hypothetical protein